MRLQAEGHALDPETAALVPASAIGRILSQEERGSHPTARGPNTEAGDGGLGTASDEAEVGLAWRAPSVARSRQCCGSASPDISPP
jgi:hypothetical protein